MLHPAEVTSPWGGPQDDHAQRAPCPAVGVPKALNDAGPVPNALDLVKGQYQTTGGTVRGRASPVPGRNEPFRSGGTPGKQGLRFRGRSVEGWLARRGIVDGDIPAWKTTPLEFVAGLEDHGRLPRLPGTGDGDQTHGTVLGQEVDQAGYEGAAVGR